jgi:hypothetical protein
MSESYDPILFDLEKSLESDSVTVAEWRRRVGLADRQAAQDDRVAKLQKDAASTMTDPLEREAYLSERRAELQYTRAGLDLTPTPEPGFVLDQETLAAIERCSPAIPRDAAPINPWARPERSIFDGLEDVPRGRVTLKRGSVLDGPLHSVLQKVAERATGRVSDVARNWARLAWEMEL